MLEWVKHPAGYWELRNTIYGNILDTYYDGFAMGLIWTPTKVPTPTETHSYSIKNATAVTTQDTLDISSSTTHLNMCQQVNDLLSKIEKKG